MYEEKGGKNGILKLLNEFLFPPEIGHHEGIMKTGALLTLQKVVPKKKGSATQIRVPKGPIIFSPFKAPPPDFEADVPSEVPEVSRVRVDIIFTIFNILPLGGKIMARLI